jgi:hypothetical protein
VVSARLADTLAPRLTVGRDPSTRATVVMATGYGGGGSGAVVGGAVEVGAVVGEGDAVVVGITRLAEGGREVADWHPSSKAVAEANAALTMDGREGVERP